jgi:putative membrane protein
MRQRTPEMAVAFTLLFALLGVTACADGRPSERRAAGGAPVIQSPADSAAAYVLGFLNVANASDIEEGRLAQEKARSLRVKDYARRMVEDHQTMLRQGSSTATQLQVAPALDAESRTVFTGHTKVMEKLRDTSGLSFDRAYIKHEIATHQEVLHRVDQAAKEARHPELKQLLKESRPVIQSHLDQAMLLNELLSGEAAG